MSNSRRLEDIKPTILPVASKSADTSNKKSLLQYDISPEKSTSLTLAERRTHPIPASLKLSSSCTPAALAAAAVVEKPQQTYSEKEQQNLITNIINKLLPMKSSIEMGKMEQYKEFLNYPMDVKNRMDLLVNHQKISQEQRSTIWKALSQPSLKIQILYDQLSEETGPYDTMIEKDQRDPATIRILKAYSIYDVRVGYHSSLSSLLIPLFDAKMPENQVFALFVRLMETYDMRTLYMLNMEGLDLLLQQFKVLLTQSCPQLESHLNRLSIQPSMYASTWFLTLFQPQPHLYDLVFLQGAVQTMIRASICLLKKYHDKLMQMDNKNEILDFLSNTSLNNITIYDIISVDITNLDLSLEIPQPQQRKQLRKKTNSSVPLLKQQLEDVVMSLSKLQRDYIMLTQENKTLRMKEMDQEAAQLKLVKKNTVLEKRVKKYKVKLANASTSLSTDISNKPPSEEEDVEEDSQQIQKSKKQDQFSSFVASLRDTGDFGALIAGALVPTTANASTTTNASSAEDAIEQLAVAENNTHPTEETNQMKLDSALQNVTSELVAVKLDHFETCQKYQSLVAHCQDLAAQMNTMQESQTALCQKVIYLESELEDVIMERDQIYADQEEVLSMAMVAKKTSAELQLEKMSLAKEVEKLESTVHDLQKEKEAFFMPRNSFTEEVFAAHTILFAPKQSTKESRRHTMQITKQPQEDEYKTKFVESELRCRELEKYLAETKVRLAEFESGMTTSCTPRGSLQRAASFNMNKRNSTASSLSMLANRTSTPTSPRERRESTESYASSTTSFTSLSSSSHYNNNNSSKRSSVYSRIWNAFGSPPATPTNTTANTMMLKSPSSAGMIMCEESQII